MTRNKKNRKIDPYARYKMAAIPVLLGILGCVLWSNSQPDDTSQTTLAQAPDSGQAAAAQPVLSDAPPAKPAPERRPWPEVDADFLEGPNPLASYRFKKPELGQLTTTEASQPVPAPIEAVTQVTQELRELPVRYHFKSGRRNVMMLGDRLLEAGDSLSEDLHLVEIQRRRLVLTVHDANESKTEPATTEVQ